MSFVPKVEICVEGVDEAVTADACGADRVELCASLAEGGLTVSAGTLRQALDRVRNARIMAIVRPRGGDFLYSEAEFASMLDDVSTMRNLGVPGAVSGCLRPDGTIDEPRMAALVETAGGMEITCHRAFDMTPDPFDALETLIRCGVTRVLTSGQKPIGRDGLPLLRQLVKRAQGRIDILVCGALTPADIDPQGEGLTNYEFHFACADRVGGPMEYRNPEVFMGAEDGDAEYLRRRIDTDQLSALIRASRGMETV